MGAEQLQQRRGRHQVTPPHPQKLHRELTRGRQLIGLRTPDPNTAPAVSTSVVNPNARTASTVQPPPPNLVRHATEHARAAGCTWLHVDFEEHLHEFYLNACGFTPTTAGLIAL